MAHAIEIRIRAVELIKEGYTQKTISEILNVGTTSIKRWKNQIEELDCISTYYDTSNRVAPKIPDDKLKKYYESNSDALLKEAAKEFNCTPQAIFYACKRNKITYKKKSLSIKNVTNKSEKDLERQ